MIPNSIIVTNWDYKSGTGKYAWNLYKLGFFENFLHLSYNCISEFQNHICFSKRWSVNILTSLYIGGVYKKAVLNKDFVHSAGQDQFHLVRYNKNTVGTLHDLFGFTYSKNFLQKHFHNKNINFIPKLKGVITISDRVKSEIEKIFPDVDFVRIHHWLDDPNFKIRDKIETRRKLGLNTDKIYLLNVARDAPRKNIDLLPNILNKLDERFVLIRIGDTKRILPKFKNKNQVIEILNVPDEQYALFFNAADMLVHTAIDGGFEIPYLEAIFSNLPIITFDLPISREILRDRGIFVNLGNDKLNPDDWVDKILKYYDHRPDYNDLKNYYSKERAKKEYESFYRSLGFL